MSDKRIKRSSEIINELSTSAKGCFLTPERPTSMKRDHAEIDDCDYDALPGLFGSGGHPTQGDRFIPKRGSAISRQLFNMPENVLASPSDVSNKNEKEQNSLIFENLLEQKLLKLKYEQMNETVEKPRDNVKPQQQNTKIQGVKSSKSHTTPIKKMNDQHFIIKRPKLLNFSDKKDDRMSTEDPSSEFIVDSKVMRSIRNMRKISKSPFKVLDAPGLLDDFYQVGVFFGHF